MMLDFYDSGYGNDFECVWEWPDSWPQNIEFADGSVDFYDPYIWFKAYDTSLCENEEDAGLYEQGYLFNCIIRTRYDSSSFYCEDVLAKFPAKDREEAKRLLTLAAKAIYEEEA